MDELIRAYAARLDKMITEGTYAGIYSGLGFLADFSRAVREELMVTRGDE